MLSFFTFQAKDSPILLRSGRKFKMKPIEKLVDPNKFQLSLFILAYILPIVVNLTLIDLPGLTKVIVEGQPDNIVHGIDNMVRSYIEKGIEIGLHFAVVTIL